MEVIVALCPNQSKEQGWVLAEPFLAKAISHADGRADIGDLKEVAMSDFVNIWLVSVDNEIAGGFLTRIDLHPKKKYLTVLALGGKEISLWLEKMYMTLVDFARDQKCDQISFECRRGWEKHLVPFGFKVKSVFMELEIAGTRSNSDNN